MYKLQNKKYYSLQNKKYYSILLFFIALILVLISFPKIDGDMTIGVDGSYFAMYNYWFAFDNNIFQDIYFPYGAFGFLISPGTYGFNFEISIIFISVCRLLIAFFLLYLFNENKKSLFISIPIILYLLFLFNTLFLTYSIVLITIILYEEKRNWIYIIISGIFVAISCFIKINSCVFTICFFGSYFFYLLFQKRLKESLIIFLIPFISVIIIWLLLFGSFNNIISSFYYWIILCLGNSDYLSIYPENNWYILISIFVLLIAIPFLIKDKKVSFVFIIMAITILTCFKYSFAREENTHIRTFFLMLCLLSSISIALMKTNKVYYYLLFLLIPFLSYINMGTCNCYHTQYKEKPYNGLKNFNQIVLNIKEFKQESNKQTEKAFSDNKLSNTILSKIGNKGIDFFPWDISYPLMNKLNYIPNKTLQSIVHIEDKKTENLKNNELKFILWKTKDWNGPIGGIDNHYLPNATGGYFYEFMNSFSPIYSEEKVVLFERNIKPNFKQEKEIKEENFIWNKWQDVPIVENGILKAKININPSLLGILKSIAYKPNPIFIEYKLNDKEIKQYKLTSDIFSIGAWINPYIYDVKDNLKCKRTIQIRFVSENSEKWFKGGIKIKWLYSEFNNQESKSIYSFE